MFGDCLRPNVALAVVRFEVLLGETEENVVVHPLGQRANAIGS